MWNLENGIGNPLPQEVETAEWGLCVLMSSTDL